MSKPPGIASIVEALLQTMHDEADALTRLTDAAEGQLSALQVGEGPEGLNPHQEATQEAVGSLEHLRASRERHLRLLGRLLGLQEQPAGVATIVEALREQPGAHAHASDLLDARSAVRDGAEAAKAQCEALDFALRYALSLGQEMMQAISALNVPAPPKVYTARGDASAGNAPRSLVDRIG